MGYVPPFALESASPVFDPRGAPVLPLARKAGPGGLGAPRCSQGPWVRPPGQSRAVGPRNKSEGAGAVSRSPHPPPPLRALVPERPPNRRGQGEYAHRLEGRRVRRRYPPIFTPRCHPGSAQRCPGPQGFRLDQGVCRGCAANDGAAALGPGHAARSGMTNKSGALRSEVSRPHDCALPLCCSCEPGGPEKRVPQPT